MSKISYVIFLLLFSLSCFGLDTFKLRQYKGNAPHKLLVEALRYAPDNQKKIAIDLGAGYGNETELLLQQNFKVFAFDGSKESDEIIHKRFSLPLHQKKLVFQKTRFEDIEHLPNVDIILAINSLPFMNEESFPNLWSKIKNSLSKNGVFVVTFFGPEKNLKRGKTSQPIFRLNENQIKALFDGFEIVYFSEFIKKDLQSTKSWGSNQYDHRFGIIAIKK